MCFNYRTGWGIGCPKGFSRWNRGMVGVGKGLKNHPIPTPPSHKIPIFFPLKFPIKLNFPWELLVPESSCSLAECFQEFHVGRGAWNSHMEQPQLHPMIHLLPAWLVLAGSGNFIQDHLKEKGELQRIPTFPGLPLEI